MITLGINAAFHDSAAALVRDGELIAAAEEERFSRVKHAKRPVPFSTWELPFNAIDFCLQKAGITLGQVDEIGYSVAPTAAMHREVWPSGARLPLPEEPMVQSPRDMNWEGLFASYVMHAPGQLVDGAPLHLKARLGDGRMRGSGVARFAWHYVDHHLAHQASAFLAAPFNSCAVMSIDGRGERATTTYGVYRDSRYEKLSEVLMPHSLGLLYEGLTEHLGFLPSSDEYKVMAMAAMGHPRMLPRLRERLHLGESGTYCIKGFDRELVFGAPRERGAPLEAHHYDAAASVQQLLEEVVLHQARWLREQTGESCLAMAGGVALNCVMNSRLRDAGLFDQVWVQPAAGDAGTALGAALWIDANARGEVPGRLGPRQWFMMHPYWGPEYDDAQIETFLRWAKVKYRRLDALEDEVADRLARDEIVGWFQGPMEFGPRALGARSILASPLNENMRDRLNAVKDREEFRPVAPVIVEEALGHWFTPERANSAVSPFMLFLYDVRPEVGTRIPSACHIDGTARVQTVSAVQHPRLHALLKAFERRSGVPILVNTSFNVRGEPIVCTPRDALSAFFSSPLDVLVMGSYIVEKT